MWLAARFDRTMRLALAYVGRPALVSSRKAEDLLGWKARPAAESILSAAESLLAFGLVRPARRAATTR